MTDDPIVEEVRAVRRRLLADCGEHLDMWLDQLKAAEAAHADRIVTVGQLRMRCAQPGTRIDAV